MKDSTPTDLKNTLQDLSTSSFPFIRQEAANKLGQLLISNDDIVQALAAAVALDGDANVRSAALQALQSPVNQAFIKDHPDFIRKVTDAAAQTQAEEKQRNEEKTMTEYLHRRTRERIYYLILFGGMVTSFVLFLAGLIQGWLELWMVRAWQVIFIAFVILIFYLTWRNWRCPACDSWLGGFTYTINAVWSPATIRCPHCGARLL